MRIVVGVRFNAIQLALVRRGHQTVRGTGGNIGLRLGIPCGFLRVGYEAFTGAFRDHRCRMRRWVRIIVR
ncbi:MAG: hypothetical protein P9X24_13085, partial [Candidatus Hatepunaea meridiana]|nr:hypothetical protein [Candidatus Hatepunaea meridiana]